MKFLLAVDGSNCSIRAAEYLAGHLDLFKTQPELHLVNVHAPIASARVRSYVGKEALDKYYAEESEDALKPACAVMDAKGLKYQTVKLVGEIATEVNRKAAELGCTMIVMGTHGHGNLGNLLMGSVATKVLAESKIPVLLIK
jgi:nucleotide-binding universal stress UspA family protein